MSPRRIAYLLVFSVLWSLAYTQELQSYKHVKVLSGESIDVPVESSIYPDFLRRPDHGTVARFKFGYEDVYRVRYTASDGFVGIDTVIYKTQRIVNGKKIPFFEGFVVESSAVLAEADYYTLHLEDGTVNLDVLANDHPSVPNLKVKKLSYVSSGSASISADQTYIRFTPSSAGYTRIGYIACGDGGCSAGYTLIRVDSENAGPVGDTIRYLIERDESVTILVAPGFNPPSSTYYSGTLTRLGPQIYNFQAELGFTGIETLRFSQITGGEQILHIATIEIIDPFANNGWNNHDQFYTEVGSSLTFSVLDNDLGGQISQIDPDGLKGTLISNTPGQFTFTPQAGFRGQTKFSYEVCAEGRCDVADVYLTVHNYEPLYPAIHLYTTRNNPLFIDYEVPIDKYSFSVINTPLHGVVTISPDGKSLTYDPSSGYSGPDVFQLKYCAGLAGFCQTLSVSVNVQDQVVSSCTDCIWPGDHNNDGIVDVQDAVVLATNLGYTGPSRTAYNPEYWYGQTSLDWPAANSVGTRNLKYVDSNGDGLTSTEDLQAVRTFYEKAHAIPFTPPVAMEAIPLHLDLLTPEVQSGDWAVVEVSLGLASLPVRDLLGICFSFEAGSHFVDSSSLSFSIAEDGLFNPVNSLIAFAESPQDGRIDVGIGKTDKHPISGHGVLGQIRFIVEEDLNGFRSLKDLLKINVRVNRIGLLSDGQDMSSLQSTQAIINLHGGSLDKEKITYFPNPAGSWLQVQGAFKSIRILNLHGQTLMHRDQDVDPGSINHARQFDLQHLESGLYLIQIESPDGEVLTEKLEVMR